MRRLERNIRRVVVIACLGLASFGVYKYLGLGSRPAANDPSVVYVDTHMGAR